MRPHHFVTAMRHLRTAGYAPGQLGVYILCGLPGQSLDEVRQAIDLVIDEGATPRLAEYSPIPGTREWEKAVRATELPIAEEPLLQNNSIFAWASGAVSPEALSELRHYANERAAAKLSGGGIRGFAAHGAEAAPPE